MLLFTEDAEVAHRHAGGDRRKHARRAELLRDEERAESRDRGQSRLDEMIVGGARDRDRH
jgi:hypothetical protein